MKNYVENYCRNENTVNVFRRTYIDNFDYKLCNHGLMKVSEHFFALFFFSQNNLLNFYADTTNYGESDCTNFHTNNVFISTYIYPLIRFFALTLTSAYFITPFQTSHTYKDMDLYLYFVKLNVI